MAFGALAYDPMTGLPIGAEEPDPTAPVVVTPQGTVSKVLSRLTGTQFGEPRVQLWPEKLVRSALTLPGDVVSGEQPMLPPGLRREDYTDAAPAARGQAEGIFGNTLFTPQPWQPNDPAYERAQDTAGLAGGGMMFGRLGGPAAASLGRDVRVLGRKVGSGEPFPHQLIDQPVDAARPPWASYPPGNPGYTGAEMPRFDLEHRPRGAVDAQIDADLGWHANDAGLTAVSKAVPRPWETGGTRLLEDSAAPGAPLSALEHAPKFYSAAERTVEALPMNRATGDQWLGTLTNRGVKPEEMDWTGLRDFLSERGNQPVTKAQVVEHLGANKLELGEVHKADITDPLVDYLQESYGPATRHIQTPQDVADARKFNSAFRETTKGLSDEEVLSAARKSEQYESVGDPKFHDYQLPGGENYREKLLTLPIKDRRPVTDFRSRREMSDHLREKYGTDPNDPHAHIERATAEEQRQFWALPGGMAADRAGVAPQDWGGVYKSSHWDEPNVLVHRRTNERDVNGKPSLHIEEIQSDWHQKGRKEGYAQDSKGWTAKRLNDPDAGFNHWEISDANGNYVTKIVGGTEESAIRKAAERGVPDAPFKKNWHELALKDAIREAAEKGFDRISWTPGEAQAARYDLSKHVSGLKATPIMDQHGLKYEIVAEGHGGGEAFRNVVTEAELPNVVGKEMAQKIVERTEGKKPAHFLGLDLKVGGEGMKGFYDKMIPDALNKIGKPHGVKVERGEVPADKAGWHITPPDQTISGKWMVKSSDYNSKGKLFDTEAEARKVLDTLQKREPVHYMDIPQSLTDQALKKGFSLFEDAAAAGAPLAAAEAAARAESPAAPYHAMLDQPASGAPAAAYHALLDPFGTGGFGSLAPGDR